MRQGRLIVLAAVGVTAAGILTGEAQPFRPSVQPTFVAPSMPPPMARQVVPISPGPGFVWAPGSWAWSGGTWVWAPGTWVRPPRAGAVWVSPRWNRRGRGSVRSGGFWR